MTHDGHRFIADARARGAALVIVDRRHAAAIAGPRVLVRDTAEAEPALAGAVFGWPGRALRLAGITGTNGKTTTAHLVGAILQEAGRLHARFGTTGNWIVDHEQRAAYTTPFALELQRGLAEARDRGATDAVMEVSSHALAQGRVGTLAFAAVGLTSFSQDHLDFHATMADYLEAKLLLPRVALAKDGVAVAAVDDGGEAARRFLAAARERGCTAFRASRGREPRAEIVAEQVRLEVDRTLARVHTPAGVFELSSPLVAAYNLDNALVATGLGLGLGVELAAIERALAWASGAPGRLEPVVVPGVAGPRVIVDYAHTPDAVERAIAAVRAIARGRVIVVLGCGGDRDPGKRPLMGGIAARTADRFIATSDNPRSEDPERILDDILVGIDPGDLGKVIREVDRARAIALAIREADPDDLVLVAGKGHEDYQILGKDKIHFDDREHARLALAATITGSR